jgi:hypothetical protein
MTPTRLFPLLALLAGCGGDGSAERIALDAEVRLLGRNAAGYQAVLVEVKDLLITAGERQLAVTPGQTGIDLTRADEAWLAGAVAVPVGIEQIHVALRLDDFGGYQAAPAAGSLDARTAPIEFDATLAQLGTHKMATVRVDLGASLVELGDDTRLLLPHLDLVF